MASIQSSTVSALLSQAAKLKLDLARFTSSLPSTELPLKNNRTTDKEGESTAAEREASPAILPSGRDAISKLPEEIKWYIVDFLCSKDAASLRLSSRCWAHTASRGLFNKSLSMFSHIGVDETNSHSMIPYRLGVLRILPSSNWDALIEDRGERKTAAILAKKLRKTSKAESVEPLGGILFPETEISSDTESEFDGFSDTEGFSDVETIESLMLLLNQIPQCGQISRLFSLLPKVENLSILSNEFPRLDFDHPLRKTWGVNVDLETLLGRYRLQNISLSTSWHFQILSALSSFKNPIQRLKMDFVPQDVFGHLGWMMNSRLFGPRSRRRRQRRQRHRGLIETCSLDAIKRSLTNVTDFRVLVTSERLNGVSDLPYFKASSGLGLVLGAMPNLKSLDLKMLEDWAGDLHPWRFWHPALFDNTWNKLESLRLDGFYAPDTLLSRFLSQHATSLRKVSLSRCLTSCKELDEARIWPSEYQADNFRSMLETIKKSMKLDVIEFTFDIFEDTIYDEHWHEVPDLKDDPTACPGRLEQLRGKDYRRAIHRCFNDFIQDECTWPMTSDNPISRDELDMEDRAQRWARTCNAAWVPLPLFESRFPLPFKRPVSLANVADFDDSSLNFEDFSEW